MMEDRHRNIEEKEALEINFWRDSDLENPNEFTRGNFLNKTRECLHFDYKLCRYRNYLKGKTNVLEVGAGQGWASCYLKKYFLPDAQFTVSDISPYAVQSLKYWEDVFGVHLLNHLACKSYEVPLRDHSFDLIFCYAAAHHFVKLDETLKELKRLLVPGGHILFLYEPTCSRLVYPLHFKLVNRGEKGSPEDVLIPSEIKQLAEKHGLDYRHIYDPEQRILRSVTTAVYYKLLKAIPVLQRLLPASSDFVFSKG